MPTKGSRRSRTAKKPKVDPNEGWFNIRRILDERVTQNGTEYLVDWEDDPQTGEVYEATWSNEVTEDALNEWGKRKTPQEPSQNSNVGGSANNCVSSQDSQDSQPPRPANFRHANKRPEAAGRPRPRPLSSNSDSQTEPPRKAPRLRYSYSPSVESVPSIVSAPSPATTSGPLELAERSEGVVVGIPKDPSFQPSDYLSVSATDSQSNSQSQSIAEQEEQDNRLALQSQLSQSTIPDSQDFSAQALSSVSLLHTSELRHSHSPAKRDAAPILGNSEGNSNTATSEPTSGPTFGASYIPSHQEIPSQLQGQHQLPETSQTSAVDLAGGAGLRGPSVQNSSSGDRVCFLTQLDYEINLSATSSSYKSQISESPQRVLVAASSQLGPQRQRSQRHLDDPKGSQDAQIVDRGFNSLLEQITGSSSQSNMAERSSTDTPSKRSAVDELHELFTLGSTVPDSRSALPPAEPLQQSSATTSNVESNTPAFATAREGVESQGPVEAPELFRDKTEDSGEAVKATQPSQLQASEPSATQALHNIIDMAFSAPEETQTLPLHPHGDEQTISPADILKSGTGAQGLMQPSTYESSGEPIPLGQHPESTSSSSPGPVQMQHVITLPFQASLRPQYDATLVAQKGDVTSFGKIFSSEDLIEPEPALVERIDSLFRKLFSLCDYPQDIVGTVLEDLAPAEQIKYACNANSKFCFLFELLQGIETDTRVLIITRSRELVRLLGHLTDALEIGCTSVEKKINDFTDSAASVTLALPEEVFDTEAFDLVIGYDHGFGASPIARALSPMSQTGPMVLTLVTTYSIEHIDLQLPDTLDPLERKNALLSGIVRARQLVDDPDRGYPEPHELAELFCDFLNGKADGIVWDPIPLPEEVLDVYLSSQSRSQAPLTADENARKRKLDDSDEEDVKRMRTIPRESIVRNDDVPLPDEIQWLLQSVASAEEAQHGRNVLVNVRLSTLQALAEKVAEMERAVASRDATAQYQSVIKDLESRVQEYERGSSKVYSSLRAAIEDRAKFEQEAKKAAINLQTAKESAERENNKAQSRIRELEEKVTRLTADSEESPLAVSERLLKEAHDKIQGLEKRLENARADGEYAKNMYQEASSAGTALRGENNELRGKNEELSKKTEDTMGKIHQIQADSMAKAYVKQIDDLKTQMRDRELELDRTREELRQVKNGRRETRQVSVPRSPRMGMMSPRPPGRPYGGSASRGTSPTLGVEGPLMSTMATPGNGRWDHLRE